MRNKTALIAGAANEIGLAICSRLAKNGAKLLLVDSGATKLAAIAKKLAADGAEVETIAVDLANPAAVAEAAVKIAKAYKTIDILVNNIDHKDGTPISQSSLESWARSINTNVTPLVALCLGIIPEMRANNYGRIVNVGSLEYLGFSNISNYSASKSAIFGLTRSFALELAQEGITVNQVIKGDVQTADDGMAADAEEQAAERLPVKRLGKPDDIAYAVAYFASESTGYVTGQNLIVCGGKSIYSSMSA
ncbi:SDR family NAD(P)-dependent oxidoreductase [Desulfuromonas sp. TF]|uniref:SDR family NAD(P)-dependent oxidoreductase n=1 Tax=Desulfuromonas sp. TF TaxID=1232410 RepID=UPI0003FD5B1F|nr:SDR family oxidoreductase [Desulfuromonas sp. TF]